MNSSLQRSTTWFIMINLLMTVVIAQQQQPTTYLDIGGVFPLLTTTGAVDSAGVMRQAGKNTNLNCLCFFLISDQVWICLLPL